MCYVASDYKSEGLRYDQNAEGMSRSYELPDATVITVGPDRYKCPEILFQPSLLGADGADMQGAHALPMWRDQTRAAILAFTLVIGDVGSTTPLLIGLGPCAEPSPFP